MHLNCPECNTPVTADGVNIVKTIAVCKSCDNIFAFDDHDELTRPGDLAVIPELQNPGRDPNLPPRLKEEIYHIPPGIEVLKIESMLEIMINWRRSGKYFLLFFAIMWNLMLGFMLIMVFSSGAGAEGLFLMLFMLPFIAVGGFLLYSGLGQIFNTTYLTVTNRHLSIEHKPLNLLTKRDKFLNIEDITQLYVKRYTMGTSNGQPIYAYTVMMKLKNGKSHI